GAEMSKKKTDLQSATFATNSGRRLLNAGDLDGAVSQFRAAIRAVPSYALAHYELALALSQKGLRDEASGEYRKAAELDPQLAPPASPGH
ncbi:MAG: tetratricopeptide repeat protein, partial [Candidatus Sulfotelmatobacter sp.]